MDPNINGFLHPPMNIQTNLDLPFGLYANVTTGYANEFHPSNDDLNRFFDTEVNFDPTGRILGSNNAPDQSQQYFDDGFHDGFPFTQPMDAVEIEFPTANSLPMGCNDQIAVRVLETSQSPVSNTQKEADITPNAPPAPSTLPQKKRRQSRKRKKQPSEEEQRAKRAKFLERNRLAASKCRSKRKDWTTNLEERLKEFSDANSALFLEAGGLLQQTRLLREEIMLHKDCNHQLIVEYVMNEAQRIANNPGPRFSDAAIRAKTLENSYESGRGVSTDSMNDKRQSIGSTSSHQSMMQESAGGLYQFEMDGSANDVKHPSLEASCSMSPEYSTTDMTRQHSEISMGSGLSQKIDSGISSMGTPPDKAKMEVYDDEGYGGSESSSALGNVILSSPQLVGHPEFYGSPHLPGPCLAFGKTLSVFSSNFQDPGLAEFANPAEIHRPSVMAVGDFGGISPGSVHSTYVC